jgi:hypothetical protein
VEIGKKDLNNGRTPYTSENCKSDATFSVKILPNEECYELDLCDYEQYENKSSRFNEDRSLRTFLEMVCLFCVHCPYFLYLNIYRLLVNSPLISPATTVNIN